VNNTNERGKVFAGGLLYELSRSKLRGIKKSSITSKHFIAPRRQERKEKHDCISRDLASFAPLRERSFLFPKATFQPIMLEALGWLYAAICGESTRSQ
jgi:hypothetical protein